MEIQTTELKENEERLYSKYMFILPYRLHNSIIQSYKTSTNYKSAPQKYTGWPKKFGSLLVRLITSSNTDQFSNRFHCQNQEKICNNTVTKEPTTPQMCRYTTLWNVSVLKATPENTTTSVTTHFKSASSSSKADKLNIWCKNCRMRQIL